MSPQVQVQMSLQVLELLVLIFCLVENEQSSWVLQALDQVFKAAEDPVQLCGFWTQVKVFRFGVSLGPDALLPSVGSLESEPSGFTGTGPGSVLVLVQLQVFISAGLSSGLFLRTRSGSSHHKAAAERWEVNPT